MKAWLKTVIKPVHRHSHRLPWEWHLWNEPFAELHPREHGVIKQLSSESVSANGLVLGFEDFGFITVRVN